MPQWLCALPGGRERKAAWSGGRDTDPGVEPESEEPPQTLRPPVRSSVRRRTAGQPRPRAYREAGPGPAVPRRVLQNRDATGRERPRLPRRAPRLSSEREAEVQPPLPISGHVTNLHPEVQPAGEEGEAVMGVEGRGKVRLVSRTGGGVAPVAQRLPWDWRTWR